MLVAVARPAVEPPPKAMRALAGQQLIRRSGCAAPSPPPPDPLAA